MGFAKYMEDNIEIFNNRMYERHTQWHTFDEFKTEQKKKPQLISNEEEYLSVLNELIKIEKWLEMIEKMNDFFHSEIILDTLDYQKAQLSKAKDDFIDYTFNPKFRTFRDKKFNLNKSDLKPYETRIIESYALYFIDKIKMMKNDTNDDAIALNFLYWDIGEFANKFMKIDIKSLEIPLIKYLRESILKDGKCALSLCDNCGSKTYRDFNTCIYCKYPREVK